MGKAEPLRWLENAYLRQHLVGRGLEIGALWRRFPVAATSRVFYMDRATIEDLKLQYEDVSKQIFAPDVIGDASDLPFAPGKLDFLIASHVLEHLPFPLAALRSWYDALALSGRLLIKVPDKRYTFDRDRQRTPLAHLVAEYEHPELTDWNAHYTDWIENVDHRQPSAEEIIDGGAGLRSGQFNIHFHVWTADDVVEMVNYTREELGLDWKVTILWRGHFYRKEVTLLLVRGR